MPLNCAKESSQAYVPSVDNPWDLSKITHLYRRTTFGASIPKIKSKSNTPPIALVNQLVDDAKALPLTPEPVWAKWQLSDYSQVESERNAQIASQILEWTRQWTRDMKSNGLRDRMSWFWHNHFVTKNSKYICPSWMYEYHKLLQKHALGNFKDFVREMGKSSAMLVFLDGVQNTRFQPNENYARELYELFTLGVDNGYTQQDIVNTARALSGWNGLDVNNLCGNVTFVPSFWDPGSKTIFGKTDKYGYDEVIDLLFAERPVQISEHITRKIYKNFVNPDVSEPMVKAFAKILRDNNFEIAPLMKAMLSSEHFFDINTISTIIPGHIEYFMTFLNEMDYPQDEQIITLLAYSGMDYDQQIFNPTDVSGWPGNRSWITSSSLPYRIDGIRNLIGYYYSISGNNLDHLRNLAKLLTSDESNVQLTTKSIIDFFLPKGLQNVSDYNDAVVVFKADVPENYFTSGQWNLDWEYAPLQVYLLLVYISNLPEYQLR